MRRAFCVFLIFLLLITASCGGNAAITPSADTTATLFSPTATATEVTTPTPTVSPSSAPTLTPSATATVTPKPTAIATPKPTAIPTPRPTATVSGDPTPLPTPWGGATPLPTPYSIPADYNGTYVLNVNREYNRVVVYAKAEDGTYTRLIKVMVCSVGEGTGSGATPIGSFRTSDKYVWRALYGDSYGQYATRFYGAYLFHSVPYTRMSKDSLKTKEYNQLGRKASMGCVRLAVIDAKWIYDNCEKGTLVNVYDGGPEPYTKPAVKLPLSDPKSVWDPTDPDINNPWHAENQ